jgi:hypothetical protein
MLSWWKKLTDSWVWKIWGPLCLLPVFVAAFFVGMFIFTPNGKRPQQKTQQAIWQEKLANVKVITGRIIEIRTNSFEFVESPLIFPDKSVEFSYALLILEIDNSDNISVLVPGLLPQCFKKGQVVSIEVNKNFLDNKKMGWEYFFILCTKKGFNAFFHRSRNNIVGLRADVEQNKFVVCDYFVSYCTIKNLGGC